MNGCDRRGNRRILETVAAYICDEVMARGSVLLLNREGSRTLGDIVLEFLDYLQVYLGDSRPPLTRHPAVRVFGRLSARLNLFLSPPVPGGSSCLVFQDFHHHGAVRRDDALDDAVAPGVECLHISTMAV